MGAIAQPTAEGRLEGAVNGAKFHWSLGKKVQDPCQFTGHSKRSL